VVASREANAGSPRLRTLTEQTVGGGQSLELRDGDRLGYREYEIGSIGWDTRHLPTA
jgi:hypothetical protein